MSKKTNITGFIIILAFSILLFPTLNSAEQHYLQFSGNGFVPEHSSAAFFRSPTGYLYHDDFIDESYCCPVTFSVPEGSTYFIKSLGIRYYDNLVDGYIGIVLRRKNLFTGTWHNVASWTSSSSSSDQTTCHGTISGYKLIDTKKFSYWLEVLFFRDADLTPGSALKLYQVRVHYGT